MVALKLFEERQRLGEHFLRVGESLHLVDGGDRQFDQNRIPEQSEELVKYRLTLVT